MKKLRKNSPRQQRRHCEEVEQNQQQAGNSAHERVLHAFHGTPSQCSQKFPEVDVVSGSTLCGPVFKGPEEVPVGAAQEVAQHDHATDSSAARIRTPFHRLMMAFLCVLLMVDA